MIPTHRRRGSLGVALARRGAVVVAGLRGRISLIALGRVAALVAVSDRVVSLRETSAFPDFAIRHSPPVFPWCEIFPVGRRETSFWGMVRDAKPSIETIEATYDWGGY